MAIEERTARVASILGNHLKAIYSVVLQGNLTQNTLNELKAKAKGLCDEAKDEIDEIKSEVDSW